MGTGRSRGVGADEHPPSQAGTHPPCHTAGHPTHTAGLRCHRCAPADAHPEVARVALRDALAILRAGEGHPLADPRQVSELRLNRRAGFTVVLRDGSELFFGFGSPEERLDRLDRLVAAGLRLDEGPLRVDLDDPELALVRPMVDPPTAAELAAAEAEALALANPGALPADAPPSPIPAAPH